MLTARSAAGPLPELSDPCRRAHALAAARPRPASRPAASGASGSHALDRSAVFQVHILLSPALEHGAPAPGRKVMLAAYRAHLAERIRYFGPLTPVDLRV